jgi:flavin reductase (DIM6/NTAB) family NADH-FMN oxidoreductase RutF
MKVEVPLKRATRLLNHGPLVLVTSFYKNRTNIQTVAWNMPLDHTPPKVALVIASENYSYECITKTGEFVINIPPKRLLAATLQCGNVSGRKIDKFKEFQLTPIPAKKVKAPLVKECIGHLECRLIDSKVTKEYDLFLADVVYAWAEKGTFNGRWLAEKVKAKTIHHLGGKYFTFPDKVKVKDL